MENGTWRIERGEWRTLGEQRDAARRLLSQLLGFEAIVEHNEQGAPYLRDHPELHISLSHCRTAVAAAVSYEGPVGIDVESRCRIGDSLAERVCSPEERQTIDRSADPTMAFLQLWTRKEAALKCRGTGIRGFGSMVTALDASDIEVTDIATGDENTVAALATMR